MPGLTAEPCSVLSFFVRVILPDNSVPKEQDAGSASAARSVHTGCVLSARGTVSRFHRTLFMRPLAWLLLWLSSIADLILRSAFPSPSIAGANKAIKA